MVTSGSEGRRGLQGVRGGGGYKECVEGRQAGKGGAQDYSRYCL